jgi:hypothetical protein
MTGVTLEPRAGAGDRRGPPAEADLAADRGALALARSSYAAPGGAGASAARMETPAGAASSPVLKTVPHLGQRIRAAVAWSGTAPFDWHDGQITTRATAASHRICA